MDFVTLGVCIAALSILAQGQDYLKRLVKEKQNFFRNHKHQTRARAYKH
mgnify:CR=1 FL=1